MKLETAISILEDEFVDANVHYEDRLMLNTGKYKGRVYVDGVYAAGETQPGVYKFVNDFEKYTK